MLESYQIAVAGTGYVGLSLAVLLAQHNKVYALDINKEKVDMINNRQSPIGDSEIESFFSTKKLNLTATLDSKKAYENADFVIIATPTDYDVEKQEFNTKSVETVIEDVLKINPDTCIVIKSTTPIGYLNSIQKKYNIKNIIFSPEFLREGKALYDNLYPSRIVIGTLNQDAQILHNANIFAQLLDQGSAKKDNQILIIEATEAEAIKLFSNTYLAMRVAFFNELDTYAELNGLNTKSIIDGVSLDPRIGSHYNNPSFGYGGYCLPKDTKQLFANYMADNVPNNLMKAIVESNQTRKNFITDNIIQKANLLDKPNPTIGIYRLIMKSGSDNFRQSAIQCIIQQLKKQKINVIIYEPVAESDLLLDCPVFSSLEKWKEQSDIILANRYHDDLSNVKNKLYTRDLYQRD